MSPVALNAATKLRSAIPLFLAVFLTAGVFLTDMLIPKGYAVWSLYLLPLVVVTRIFRTVSIAWFTALITVLVFLGLILSPPGAASFNQSLLNRSLATVVFWTCAYILIERRKTEEELEVSYEALEGRVEERTAQLARTNKELLEEIAERRKAEAVIRKRDKQLVEAQQIAQMGNWEWDIRSNTLTWSEEMHRIYGLRQDESPESFQDFLAHVHPEDLAVVREKVRRAFSEKEPFSFDHRIVLPDGSMRTLHGEGGVVLDSSGEIVRMVGTGQDITERKKAEENIARARDYYIKLLDEFPNLIWRAGIDGRCNYFNKSWLSFTGRSLKEELGDGWLMAVHPEDRKCCTATYAEAFDARRPFVMEYRLRYHNGSFHWILDYGMPLFDVDQAFIGYIGSCFDIEERRRAQELVEHQAKALTQSNADLEQFAYVASHDLQEPLRMIQGFAQLLGRRYSDVLDDDGRQFMAYLMEGTERMQKLISNLLAYSRLDRQQKEFGQMDSRAAASRALFNLTQAVQESGAVVEIGALPVVCADETQMVQLFQNLIGNALKFRSTEPPRVQVSARSVGGEWLFTVQDNGIGIEPEYGEKIFAIFQRLHGPKEYQGTDIGLAICKKIVERHGGRIWAGSQSNHGATIFFTLPLIQEKEQNGNEPRSIGRLH
ncbi:PAS domain S-box protein [bacterium]|nr:MAG: PAS domain S-box protein [bacterium]